MTEGLGILPVPSPGPRLLEPKPTAVKYRNSHPFESGNCLSLELDTGEEEAARHINKVFAQENAGKKTAGRVSS